MYPKVAVIELDEQPIEGPEEDGGQGAEDPYCPHPFQAPPGAHQEATSNHKG